MEWKAATSRREGVRSYWTRQWALDGHEDQRTAKRLSEEGCERAAHPRYASACSGCDLEGQRADDHVEHTFHKETPSGEPLDRAETFHGFMLRRKSSCATS
jgi:hypothetical protein